METNGRRSVMTKRFYEYYIVKINNLGKDVGWTYDIKSRHMNLVNAVKTVDRKYDPNDENDLKIAELNRYGNIISFMSITEARKCVI